MTRAKDKLYLSIAKKRRLWGRREWTAPSRFVSLIKDELKKVSRTQMPVKQKRAKPAERQIEIFAKGQAKGLE